MSSPTPDPPPAVPLAHPVTGHPHVDVPIVLVVAGVVLGVLLVLLLVRARDEQEPAGATAESWAGSLSRPQVGVRMVTVALLAAAIVAGRFGSPDELDNLAPALAVGAGWPLLVVACLLAPVWRWVDPWDALARVLAPGDDSEPATQVWPAVVLAVGWLWFLGVHVRPLDPRAVGLALLAYTTVTLAGCLVRGRRRWLSSAEPVGIGLTWLAAAARGRLAPETLPRGAGALLGVMVGGLLFGVFRRTEPWAQLAAGPDATAYATVAFGACCALGAALVAFSALLGRRSRDHGAVVLGLLPGVAGLAVAAAMARNRLSTSIQLIPGLLGDPMGRGWDLLGVPTDRVDPPLGAAGLVTAQLVVVAGCFVWGAAVAARRTRRPARTAAAVVLPYLAGLSVWVIALH